MSPPERDKYKFECENWFYYPCQRNLCFSKNTEYRGDKMTPWTHMDCPDAKWDIVSWEKNYIQFESLNPDWYMVKKSIFNSD